MTPASSRGRPSKKPKSGDGFDQEQDGEYDSSFEGYDDTYSTVDVNPTPQATDQDLSSPYDDLEGDTSVHIKRENSFESPSRKTVISPTQEAFDRGISSEELHSQGWDDDHIALVHKIAMRGYEPLLPQHWKLAWSWMPDALFEEDDEAFLTSLEGRMLLGSKALESLFGLGGWVRDREMLGGRITAESQTRRMIKKYMKWVDEDAGLDPETSLPLMVLECKPTNIPAAHLQANAKVKLAALASRWAEALHVHPSIEDQPSTPRSARSMLSQPLPTLYTIIASGTVIALVAYNPNDPEPEVKSMAFFPMKDKSYDVWNSLALAITVCHLRNVRMRIADEMGV